MWKMLEKNENLGNVEKMYPFGTYISSPGRWTGNKIIFKGGLNATPHPQGNVQRVKERGKAVKG